MHPILQKNILYAAVLVKGISNKFLLTDLVLYLFFLPVWVSPANVLDSSSLHKKDNFAERSGP